MKDCEYYREKISCLIDDELSPEEKAELEKHIADCPECRALYDAFTAVSAAVRDGMEEPPEHIAPAIMCSVRACAGAKKRRVWVKYLSAAACLALVVLIGAKAGLFGGSEYGSSYNYADSAVGEAENENMDEAPKTADVGQDMYSNMERAEESQKQNAGSSSLKIDARNAYFTSAYGDTYYVDDSEALEELKALMAPLPDVKRAPEGEPDYNLSFDCGDEFIVMEIYIEDDVVFADSGDGPYVVAGSPNEIMAYIK